MYPEITNFIRHLRRKHPHTSTAVHYANDLCHFFGWAAKPPISITPPDIDAFIDHCREKGHAANTINRRLATLSSFYRFLRLTTPNFVANPVLPRQHFLRRGASLPRDVTEETLTRLFTVITSPRDRAIVTLMLRCGLRVGEVHCLSLSDLCLHTEDGHHPRLRIQGKGGVGRVAWPSPQTMTALNDWLSERPDVADDALFVNCAGTRLSIAGIQARLAHYGRLAGVAITCHQLRHTFGRHLTEQNVPLTTIRCLLGHKQLRTTRRYLYLSDKQAQTEYETAVSRFPLPITSGAKKSRRPANDGFTSRMSNRQTRRSRRSMTGHRPIATSISIIGPGLMKAATA